jgi:hypothetical protein
MMPICCPADGVGAVHVQCDRSLEDGVRMWFASGASRSLAGTPLCHEGVRTGKEGGTIPVLTAPPLVSLHLDVKGEQRNR